MFQSVPRRLKCKTTIETIMLQDYEFSFVSNIHTPYLQLEANPSTAYQDSVVLET